MNAESGVKVTANVLTSTINAGSSLFFCNSCKKPFASERSRDRHVQYCYKRSKQQSRRAKACLPCSKAKIKCDFKSPCSKCVKKGTPCTYNNIAQPNTNQVLTRPGASDINSTDLGVNATQDFTEMIGTSQSEDNPILPPDTLPGRQQHQQHYGPQMQFSDDQLASSDVISVEDGATCSNNQFDSTAASQLNYTTMDLSAHLNFNSINYELLENDSTHTDPKLHLYLNPLTSRALTSTLATPALTSLQMSSFNSRPLFHFFIASMLRGYPSMMLQPNNLPPFIHPLGYGRQGSRDLSFPEPLAICTSIAHMFVARTDQSSTFIYRTIETERQRFMDEMHSFSKEDTVAAVQALMIYMLMQNSEGGVNFFIIDSDMLETMFKLSAHFRMLCPGSFCSIDDSSSAWEDWIFAESRRRITCMCFLMVLLSSGAADAMSKFQDAPLPCAKAMWESRTQLAWENEYHGIEGKSFRLKTLNDLFNAQNMAANGLFNNIKDLDEWNSGIDGFGMLINMALMTV
ncbi:hypothetical protein F5884DRAFT_764964 [Xylogone sp. PMI_703]|nr:hypothetical protein F5884DRAFT_764964 [Xylogone sp. PMI_703]